MPASPAASVADPPPTASGGIPRYRPYAGPALFREGFRPFFLAAGLWAPAAMALWIGYLAGWIELPTAFGLVLLGASELADLVPASAALHALTAGAIGTMILALMSRATLGHTGHDLTAGAGTTATYAFITLAALARIAVWWLPAQYDLLLKIAGLAWIAGFLLFLAIYGPMLLRPRRRR